MNNFTSKNTLTDSTATTTVASTAKDAAKIQKRTNDSKNFRN